MSRLTWFQNTSVPGVDFLTPVIPDGAPETLTATAPACSVEKFVSILDGTSNNVAATLADGIADGQLKRVTSAVIGGNTITLTIASPVSSSLNVVTFTVIGDTVDLIWNAEDGYWRVYQLVDTDRDSDTPTVA